MKNCLVLCSDISSSIKQTGIPVEPTPKGKLFNPVDKKIDKNSIQDLKPRILKRLKKGKI